jgi:hypothetical protein
VLPIQGKARTSGGWGHNRCLIELGFYENGNEMIIETEKRGKWRRWLAKIYLKDADKTLNDELVEKGLAKIAR